MAAVFKIDLKSGNIKYQTLFKTSWINRQSAANILKTAHQFGCVHRISQGCYKIIEMFDCSCITTPRN